MITWFECSVLAIVFLVAVSALILSFDEGIQVVGRFVFFAAVFYAVCFLGYLAGLEAKRG